MKKLTLSTLAALVALSPVFVQTVQARDRDTASCNRRGDCVDVKRSVNHKAHAQKSPQKVRTNRTTVVNETVVVNKTKVVKKHRALPGRAVSHAELQRLPRLPYGQNYRVVNNRVVRVDSNTAEVIAALGLLSFLLGQR